jgi:hypothetical protein
MVEPRSRDHGGRRDRVIAFPQRVAILATITCMASAATAQAPVSPPIAVSGCATDLEPAVRAAVDVELSSASADAFVALAHDELRGELACSSTEVRVAVFGASGRRLDARVLIAGTALPRRIAMVIAELVDAIVAPEPEHAPEPAVVTDVEPVSPPEPPPHDRFRLRVRGAGGAWIGGRPLLALGSVEAGVELAPIENVVIVADAAAAFGSASAPDAHVDVRVFSLAASVRFGGRIDWLWLGAGPAARGGPVWWSGSPTDPAHVAGNDLVGGWIGLGAVAVIFARLGSSPVRAGIEAEGGGIALYSGALALDALIEQIGGGWFEARLAIDVALEGQDG